MPATHVPHVHVQRLRLNPWLVVVVLAAVLASAFLTRAAAGA